jgi:hypothetical protein
MARLDVPLLGRRLLATGDVVLRAEIQLSLRDRNNQFSIHTFLVDSGAEMSTMPACVAHRLDIPIPASPSPNLRHSSSGLEVRAGVIRAQVVGLGTGEYVFPCYFLGDLMTSVGQLPPDLARNFLGLTGVIDKIKITFDGTPTLGCPFGSVSVDAP